MTYVFRLTGTQQTLTSITLFRSVIVFYGTDNILRNIPHIQFEYEEHST